MQIEGYKGESKWFSHDSHFYVVYRVRGASHHMRCASERCPARLTLKNGQAGLTGEHDHELTPWVPNRNKMYQALKRRVTTENSGLNDIYEEEAARYPDAAPHLLYESVVSSMRKWRRSSQPAVPRSIGHYGASLLEHPSYSATVLASVSAGGASALILVMPGFGECLREATCIVADGTFQTVPAGLPAVQLLTIHAIIEGHFFHPIIAVMENRQRSLYEAVLQRIWQAAGHPRPAHYVTDYEPALQAALEAVSGGRVQGCFFHFVQALLRRARQAGIAVRRFSPGWRLVQLYGALALLPAARVPPALAEVPDIASAQHFPFHSGFHDYFQRYWMTRVGPEGFSVYCSPHRTSNVAESFHASLRRRLGPNPNIWRFTDVAVQKFAVSASRLQALRAGNPPRRSRDRTYIRTSVLRDNERALERGSVTIRDFLIATSRLINISVGVVADAPEDIANEIVIEHENVLEPSVEIFEEPIRLQETVGSIVETISQAPAVTCGVCIESAPTQVLIPCGHTLCADCLAGINNINLLHQCPFCRAYIDRAIPFFI